jgi:hypothetical protein
MDLLRLLAEPRKLLGGLTIAFTALATLCVFGHYDGRLPAATALLLPIVVLSVLAWQVDRALRGWLYLLAAWACGFIAYGALYPGG